MVCIARSGCVVVAQSVVYVFCLDNLAYFRCIAPLRLSRHFGAFLPVRLTLMLLFY